MSWLKGKLTVRRRRRYVLRLEALEDRCVPTCSYDPVSNTLLGDQTRNVVEIVDSGAGGWDITCTSEDGSPALAAHDSGAIEEIHVFTFQQADTVTYRLTAPYENGLAREYNFDLGQQHDTFSANLGGNDLESVSSLTLNVNGRTGKDNMTVSALLTDIEMGSTLAFDLDGNNGKDNTDVEYSGENEGLLDISMDQTGEETGDNDPDADTPEDKANGKDTVDVDVTLLPEDDDGDDDMVGGRVNVFYAGDDGTAPSGARTGSNGKDKITVNITDTQEDPNTIRGYLFGQNGPDFLYMEIEDSENNDDIKSHLNGGNGPDHLTLLIESASPNASGTIDGGNGPDKCTHTPNVVASNCEEETEVAGSSSTSDSELSAAADAFFAWAALVEDQQEDALGI